MWRVEIRDRNDEIMHHNLTLRVQKIAAGWGGPTYAQIAMAGLRTDQDRAAGWLGHRVRIWSPLGVLCWWGVVLEVTSGAGYSFSLDGVANRVKVLYTTPDGGLGATEWAEDAASVGHYGPIESVISQGSLTSAQAEALRDRVLASRPLPALVDGSAQPEGSLYCVGYYSLLAWQRYAREEGRIVHEVSTSPASQKIGWGLTSTEIGFGFWRIYDAAGRFDGLEDGDLLRVTGSTSNNGVHTVDGGPQKKGQRTYTAATIGFDALDDIEDSANLLGEFKRNELLLVAGSNDNDGYHLQKSESEDHITVVTAWGGNITTESAGASVTLEQGNSVPVTNATDIEAPGASVTLALTGAILAQRFRHSHTYPWTVGEVWVTVHRVGTPTDNLLVEITDDDSGEPAFPSTESVAIDGDLLATEATLTKFAFANTTSLDPATDYWIKIKRSGANDPLNYYVVKLDDGAGYADGDLLVWDGVNWIARSPNASLLFEVWGHLTTGEQLDYIGQAATQALFDVSMQATLAEESREYRDGTGTALDELEALLAGETVETWVEVTDARILVAREVPAWEANEPLVALHEDGRFYDLLGTPLQEGYLPVGRWVARRNAPAASAFLMAAESFLLAEAELDVQSGDITFRAQGAPDPLAVFGIEQG